MRMVTNKIKKNILFNEIPQFTGLSFYEHNTKKWFSKSGVHKFRAGKFCMVAPRVLCGS
jgi:hypothetical protein